MLAAFQLYGPGHILTLITLAVITALMVRRCRRGVETPHARAAIGLLAFCCFAAYPLNQMVWQTYGNYVRLDAIVPFHLCDFAAFICGFALITRRAALCELAYFWGLAGTLQGLLTPNLAYDFPHPIYLAFFLQHGVIVITALLLPLGLGWRPTAGAVKRVFLWVCVYAAFAMIANKLMDTNYGFLAEKPDEASLLDIMPAWPWYIALLVGLAWLMFWLLDQPFRMKRKN